MVKNLKRFKRQYERDQNKIEAAKWDFFPTTFGLDCVQSFIKYRLYLIFFYIYSVV